MCLCNQKAIEEAMKEMGIEELILTWCGVNTLSST